MDLLRNQSIPGHLQWVLRYCSVKWWWIFFFNPALPSLNRPYVSLEFGRLSEDLGRGQLELSTNFSRWFLGVVFKASPSNFPMLMREDLKMLMDQSRA